MVMALITNSIFEKHIYIIKLINAYSYTLMHIPPIIKLQVFQARVSLNLQ